MADGSKIEWTDATWNIITGCDLESPGCTNCYAMKLAGGRLQHHPSRAGLTKPSKAGPVWTGEVRFNEEWLDQPRTWSKPRMIFVCAHGDLFHPKVQDAWLDKIFAKMEYCHWHTFQVLTKRAERQRDYFRQRYGAHMLPRNIWAGVSVENQEWALRRIPYLTSTPASIRWLSCEPLLGPIELTGVELIHPHKLDWVVVGGESGKGARPMHPQWARDLRDTCAALQIPFLFKQWGSWGPTRPEFGVPPASDIAMFRPDGSKYNAREPDGYTSKGMATLYRQDKKAAGRLLDGVLHNWMPA